jgi:energy-coupling factor transport system ATP-binding protein
MANDTAKKNIIEVEHLRYVYNPGVPGETVALDDVSFAVEEGDFVGIIGATGSGKSTLIGHMNGLNRPTSGTIRIDGRDMWEDPAKIREFRFMTGLVFQYPEYQLFEETCYKDIAFGPKNMGLDESEIDRRVREAAQFVGLDEALLERSPFELSGGQKRRVAVAGVMAMEPRILVLDEPAAGLDPEGRDTILAQVKEYHKKTGTTVLLVSHSMEDIAKYANKVLVMAERRVVMYDTVSRVFARAPELLDLGLSVPQVTKIFLKLREMGLDVPTDVYTIPYAVKAILAAKARRDAGESLVLPRREQTTGPETQASDTKGGAGSC